MDIHDPKTEIGTLRAFIERLTRDGVRDRAAWTAWRKDPKHEAFMEERFWYDRKKGMPSVTALVAPHFDTEDPLIGLNYTPVAHNTLHAFPKRGWTPPLRRCRGIIFDKDGLLVSHPFPKFFNFGEHPETAKLPKKPFTATVKEDGHLLQVFLYRQKLRCATRASFDGPSARLGREMLARRRAEKKWALELFAYKTPLFEMIHPRTRVHVDYGGREELILIGCYGIGERIIDHGYGWLKNYAWNIGSPLAEQWEGEGHEDLRRLMKDRKVRNREGFVGRFETDPEPLRVKFKFETHLGLMFADKLSHGYLMKKMLAGSADDVIGMLPGPKRRTAKRMLGEINSALDRKGNEQERRERLYALDPSKRDNATYRATCRKLLAHLET